MAAKRKAASKIAFPGELLSGRRHIQAISGGKSLQ